MQYYTEEIVAGYTATAFDPDKIRREMSDPGISYLALKQSPNTDEILGYAKLVERDRPACIAAVRALYLERIYLRRSAQRRGYGEALLQAVYRRTCARGHDRLWLSVWEYNTGAIAFYRETGFHQAGSWEWPFESGGRRYVDIDWIMLSPRLDERVLQS